MTSAFSELKLQPLLSPGSRIELCGEIADATSYLRTAPNRRVVPVGVRLESNAVFSFQLFEPQLPIQLICQRVYYIKPGKQGYIIHHNQSPRCAPLSGPWPAATYSLKLHNAAR